MSDDGKSIVSHAGVALLTETATVTGLRLACRGRLPGGGYPSRCTTRIRSWRSGRGGGECELDRLDVVGGFGFHRLTMFADQGADGSRWCALTPAAAPTTSSPG